MEHQLKDSRGSVCDIFSRALPEFMAMGMTPEQFYEGHSWLAVSYKAADAIARRRANFDSYLMSAYVYDTLLRLAPMFNPFDKRKVEGMMEEPFCMAGRLISPKPVRGPLDKRRRSLHIFEMDMAQDLTAPETAAKASRFSVASNRSAA